MLQRDMSETRQRRAAAYVADDGHTPFGDWLRKLTNQKVRNGIHGRIAQIRTNEGPEEKDTGFPLKTAGMTEG